MSDELTALADELERLSWDFETRGNIRKALARAVNALRTLASQEKQEPAAWWVRMDGRATWELTCDNPKLTRGVAESEPLFAAPQKPQPAPGWDRGKLLDCAQWLEHGASLAVSAASKEQGELAARALREFAYSNASAEARLREALSQVAKLKADLQAWELTAKRIEEAEAEKTYDPTTQPFDEPFRHVDHPHASDCARDGETTKSTVGLNWKLSDETIKHLEDIERASVRHGDPRLNQIVGGPSDRTADVTVASIARECADDLVQIVEAATRDAQRTGNTFVIDRARVAHMIACRFDAFTVGRR